VIIHGPGGLRFVPGASGIARVANLSEFERHRLVEMLTELEAEADLIVVDCSAGISRNVIAFAAAADHVLLVTSPEPTALTDAYATIKVLARQRRPPPIAVVVNMVSHAAEAAAAWQRLAAVTAKFLGFALDNAGYIVKDDHVAWAVRQRRPVVLQYPHCPASRCLIALAGKMPLFSPAGQAKVGFFRRVANLFY